MSNTSYSGIQPNYQLLLEDYPFIKVFSEKQPRIIENIEEYSKKISNRIIFKITFNDDNTISLTPYINDYKGDIECKTYNSGDTLVFNYYTSNKYNIHRYVNYQLVNSGILDSLRDIPVRQITKNTIRGNITFNSSICVRLNISRTSIKATDFHQDSNLYQILNYYKKDNKPVLSSELLLYNETTNNTHIHMLLSLNNEFPQDIVGDMISKRYEMIKEIYNEIKKEVNSESEIKPSPTGEINTDVDTGTVVVPGTDVDTGTDVVPQKSTPVLFRHKLKSGDTMVFADTLLKHAVINAKENINEGVITIDIATTDPDSRADVKETVQICNERILTSVDDYDGRQLIGLSVFINEYWDLSDTTTHKKLDTFNIDDSVLKRYIPSVNLTKEQCKEMFKSLYKGENCVKLQTFSLIPRGGRNYRVKNKNPKTKTKKLKNYLKQYRGRLSGANPKIGNKFKRIKQIKTKKINIIRKNRFIKHNQLHLSRKKIS